MKFFFMVAGQMACLTTEHAASSSGVPVLLVGGVPHGAADLIDLGAGQPAVRACDAVFTWGVAPERSDEERRAAAAFLRPWPGGPQIGE